MRALVEDFIREEVYYREALALGLDRDDTVIRRRLRQKMEFLTDAGRASRARSSRRSPVPIAGSAYWRAASVPVSLSSPRPRRSIGPISAACSG